MKAFALSFVLLLSGCFTERHGGNIWLKVIPPDDEVMIQATSDAANQWRVCPGHYARLTEHNAPDVFYVSLVPWNDPDLQNKEPGDHVGVTVFSKRIIKVNNLVPKEEIAGVLAHEMGHIFGYDHSETGIMQSGKSEDQEVSPEDCL